MFADVKTQPRSRSTARKAEAPGEVEFMTEAALPFAAPAQCAFLGWPPELQGTLVKWTHRNHEATLARDRHAMNQLAIQF